MHDYFTLVPHLRTIGTKVEQVILSFGFPQTKWEYGRAYEASLHKIIPGKDAFVCYEPNESVDFGPTLCQPNFLPNLLLRDNVEGFLNTISFLNNEGAPRCVPPS